MLYLKFFNCQFLLICDAHKSTDKTASYFFQPLEVWVHSQHSLYQIGVTHKVSGSCLESLLLVLATHCSTSTLYSSGIFHDMCTRKDSHLFMPDPAYDWSHSKICFLVVKNWTVNPLTLLWPAAHICPTYKESFQVRWDNSIPLFLRAAIYLEVYLFRWTSQNAFSHETAMYKWYCVQCCITVLHTVSFVCGCFMGKCILTGSMEQRYFKVNGSMEKKWDTVIPAGLKRLFVSGTYMSHWSWKG